MTRNARQPRFPEARVKRALACAEERGMTVYGFTVAADGTITVRTEPERAAEPQKSALEKWLESRETREPVSGPAQDN